MRTYSTISNALPSIAEAMADAGVNQGLSRDLAYKLAAQTMVSLLSTDQSTVHTTLLSHFYLSYFHYHLPTPFISFSPCTNKICCDHSKYSSLLQVGAGRMVLDTGKHPAVLKDDVCSPAGSTIAALGALERNGVRNAMMQAVEAATNRCKQLGDS